MKCNNVLLVCGTGLSSGFMAKNIRVAAKTKGFDMKVVARGEAEVEDYIDEIDLLLVGPHLKYMLSDLKKIAEPYNVPVYTIPEEAYGALDGDAVLTFIENM